MPDKQSNHSATCLPEGEGGQRETVKLNQEKALCKCGAVRIEKVAWGGEEALCECGAVHIENTLLNRQELKWLFLGVIVLVLANLVNQLAGKPFWGITRFIYLGYDNNLSAWYSSFLLGVAALLAYDCWRYARRNEIRGGVSFLLFAGLLLLMAADEIAQFHEIFGGYVADYFELSSKEFAKHTAWVWLGGPLIIAIFVGFIFLLEKIVALVPRCMFYLSLGLGTIIVGGIVLESTINFLNHNELQWLWDAEIIVEESLEMIGTLLVAYALMLWRDGIVSKFHS